MRFYLLLQPGSIDMWMLKLHEGRVAQTLLLSYPSECYYTKYSKEKHFVQGRAHLLRVALLSGLVGYEIRRIWSDTPHRLKPSGFFHSYVVASPREDGAELLLKWEA